MRVEMDINASIIDQRVRGLAEAHAAVLEGDEDKRRSAAFVLLCIKTVLDFDDDDAFECLTDGGQDAGIDGIHVGDVQDGEFTVTLFQGKYKRDLEGQSAYPANAIQKVISTVTALFDPDRPITLHKKLEAQVEDARSRVRDGHIPTVRVILCNNGKKWGPDGQEFIDNFASTQVSWEHVNHERLVQLLKKRAPVNDTLQFRGRAVVEDFNYRRVLIGKVPVEEIKALFDRHGDLLLERNIRRYLGLHESRVNVGIRTTLLTASKRPNFYFYNNGITVVCSKFRHNALQAENFSVQVEDLQIINGGQTCKTIQKTLMASPEQDYSQAYVLLRLYEIGASDDFIVRDITYATNSQNPVDLRDLRANDEIQQKLEMGMPDLGYQYKRKRDEQVSSSSTTVTVGVAAEAVFAVWRRKPHQAKFRRSELFGAFYDEIFRKDLNAAQVILAVLIFRMVENERRRQSTNDPRFLPYASYVLAMLIGELLLKRNNNIALGHVDHRNFALLRDYFETNKKQLYQDAQERLQKALIQLGISDATSLQRLAATFRRGDLLEELGKIPA
jgi:hypothetical protein